MRRALLLALLVALPSGAYQRTRNSRNILLFWSTRGHTFQIDSLGTPDVAGTLAIDAIRSSFATWSAAPCSDLAFPEILPLENGDRRVGYFRGEYNRNLVLFRTRRCDAVVPAGDPCLAQGGCSNAYDCWERSSAVIATTTTTSSLETGQIFDADIELNDSPDAQGNKLTFTTVDSPPCTPGAPPPGCVSVDVQNTVTHEAGHSLGLAHSDDPTATMAATAPIGETSKRILHPDDIAGICAIYPRGAQTSTSLGDIRIVPAAGGCGCSTRAGQEGALWLLGLAALLRRRHAAGEA
jgi:MYXO-CTERM domain-containing protein